MDPLSIAVAFTALFKLILTYAILFLAMWLVAELCKIVGQYLRSIMRGIAVVYKRQALDELIALASDAEAKRELRRIKEKHEGLIVPMDEDDMPVNSQIRVVGARNLSHSDEVADFSAVGDDESYSPIKVGV